MAQVLNTHRELNFAPDDLPRSIRKLGSLMDTANSEVEVREIYKVAKDALAVMQEVDDDCFKLQEALLRPEWEEISGLWRKFHKHKKSLSCLELHCMASAKKIQLQRERLKKMERRAKRRKRAALKEKATLSKKPAASKKRKEKTNASRTLEAKAAAAEARKYKKIAIGLWVGMGLAAVGATIASILSLGLAAPLAFGAVSLGLGAGATAASIKYARAKRASEKKEIPLEDEMEAAEEASAGEDTPLVDEMEPSPEMDSGPTDSRSEEDILLEEKEKLSISLKVQLADVKAGTERVASGIRSGLSKHRQEELERKFFGDLEHKILQLRESIGGYIDDITQSSDAIKSRKSK